MYDLNSVVENCLLKCDESNVQYGEIKRVDVFNESRRYIGLCTRLDSGAYKIQISSLLLNENIPIIKLEEIILHEILHTCKNCFNHGKEWKKQAEKLNNKYNYHISRTYSFNMQNIDDIIDHYKYIIRCEKCGKVYGYQRIPKCIKNLDNYQCAICSGKLMRVK